MGNTESDRSDPRPPSGDGAPLVGSIRAAKPEIEATALGNVLQGLFGAAKPPTRIGRYLLLERIGRGGMGVVHAAYDPELDRRVAVKLIVGPNLQDARRLARLRREAQALARVSHPNVVAVHDVGVAQIGDGRMTMFVVMELVDGVTVSQWLAERSPTVREIVRAFADAGRGLAAVHAHGLVHRDFKPSNAMIDRRGVVRVLDFGLARVFDGSSDEVADVMADARAHREGDAPNTEGSAVQGTPRYMAPEHLAGGRVDARADQYSLSLALYEALYGGPPWPIDDLQRLLATRRDGRLPASPRDRRVPPHVRAVIERGLAGAPIERFPTVAAWVAALEHDPSRARRRTIAMVTGGVVLTCAIVGPPVARAWTRLRCAQAHVPTRWDDDARREMQLVAERSGLPFAGPVSTWLTHQLDAHDAALASSRAQVCDAAPTLASDDLAARHACLDHVRARLDGTVSALQGAGDSAILHATELAALPNAAPCEHASAGDPSIRPAAQLEFVHALARADAWLQIGHAEYARGIAQELAAVARRDGAVDLEAEADILVGRAAKAMGRADEAEAALGEALSLADAAGDEMLATQAMVYLADAIAVLGRRDDARAHEARRLLELARGRLERLSLPETFTAVVLGEIGELDEAAGDLPAAIANYREGLAIRERTLGPDHPLVASALDSIGVAMLGVGDDAAALAHLQRALEIRMRVLGPSHPAVGRTLNNLALVHVRAGRLREAVDFTERAIEIDEGAFASDHPQLASKLVNLGFLLLQLGDAGEARWHFEAALSILEGIPDASDRETARAMRGHGVACRELGLLACARASHAGALDLVATFAADDPERVALLRELSLSTEGRR